MTGADVRVLPFGTRALLVETDGLDDVLALAARLRGSALAGVVDLVPAARTVLVHVDTAVLPIAAARAWIEKTVDGAPLDTSASTPAVELPVVYDGADLDETARLLGATREALVAAHTAAAWTVAFTGFAPGFGYLVSEEWPFDVPRLTSPRTRVPAGSVGLAGAFSGAYPRATPGGWRLIGRTDAPLFDPSADRPALLRPGDRVQFRAARATASTASGVHNRGDSGEHAGVEAGSVGVSGAIPAGVHGSADAVAAAFVVIEPGLRATVQDQGRAGHAAEGVARSGAADRAALRTALRLLGTAEGAAGIEITMGGFRARALRDLWVAVCGAWGPLTIDNRPVDPYAAHAWPAGTELHADWFTHGARGYLAIRGGVDAPRTIGSRSTDTLAGLGPEPLRAGEVVRVADATLAPIPPDDVHPWSPVAPDVVEIALAPGPRADWFADTAAGLYETAWTVTPAADRVGIRLDGPPLVRVREGELPSEGMLPGAVQVPPDGMPVLFGPDAPVTGGYPVVAVVAEPDALGQLRPGDRVRFRHARPPG